MVCAGSEVALVEIEETEKWREKECTEPSKRKKNRSGNRYRSRDKAV